MLKRILTAAVALAILIPILLFAPDVAVQGLFSLLSVIAIYEIASVTGVKKEYGYWIPIAVLFAFGQTFVSVLEYMLNHTGFDIPLWEYRVWLGLLPIFSLTFVLVFAMIYVVLQNKKLPIPNALSFFAMSFYAAKGFDALEGLCLSEGSVAAQEMPTVFGRRLYLWIALSIPWVADSLAYFAGRFFGKKKLCPDISPKKTVAGAVGGVVGTGVVFGLLFGIFGGWNAVAFLVGTFGSMILAVASIFGDLFASVVKRHYGVKDYGNLFPGHGGVMDRFDSTIPVALLLETMLLFVRNC